MTSKATRRVPLLFTFFLISSSLCLAQEESLPPAFIKARGLPYPGIIHIHSNISEEGVYPFRRLVSLAQSKGIKILVFSDTFLMRWEYGLPVLSNVFKISIGQHSVVKYGIKNYLKDLKKIKDEFPDMLILEGVEVAPFYWWSGSPFKKNLTLNDWDRHLLVTGLRKYQDYAHLPVVGNRYFLPQLKDVLTLLIPLSLIIFGVFLFKKRKPGKFLGSALNILGILFLFNAFPFSASRYNPYHGQKGFLPYQDLIDYVHKRGGLVFWAHPVFEEQETSRKFLKINFHTLAYPESLILTSGYTGFAVKMFESTSDNLILAGREWDNVLKSYCQGRRNQPVWAIVEAEYTSGGGIDSLQNIFFLPEFNPHSAYESLRNGKFYVRPDSGNSSIDISLQDFHIEDSQDKNKSAFMGDKVEITGRPRLSIKGDYAINPAGDLRVEIIRDGQIIKEFEFTPPEKATPIAENSLTGFSNEGVFDLEFQDDSLEIYNRKSYYRLIFFTGEKIILLTNPIFIEFKNG